MRLRSAENDGFLSFLGGSTIEHLHVAVAAVAAPVVLEEVREETKLSTLHPSVIQSFRLSDKYEHNNCCFPPSPLILLPKMVVVVCVVFFPHESVISYLGTGGRRAKGGGMKGEQMWSVREASERQDVCRQGGLTDYSSNMSVGKFTLHHIERTSYSREWCCSVAEAAQ